MNKRGNLNTLLAALGAVLGGGGKSLEEHYLENKPFQGDEKVADAYSKAVEELSKISPADVDSFVISVVARNVPKADEAPTPCPGCGGFHDTETMFHYASIGGDSTALIAQILIVSENAGLGQP